MPTPATRMQTLRPSYIREILKATAQPGMISFAGGLPDAAHFPVTEIRTAMETLLSTPECFQYGATEGERPLRDWISQHLTPNTHTDVLITTGSQQALDLIARAYLNPGDTVILEAPCYLGALQVFQLAQANIITVPQTPTGPDLERVTHLIQQHKPKLFYTVPDFHNPTGVCWSLETRKAIADLLAQHPDTLLIEDAPYRDLRYTGEPLPRISDFTTVDTLLLGSFSKIITPGTRIGYVTSSAEILRPLVTIKQASDLHSARPMQTLLYQLLANGILDSHLPTLKAHYQQQMGRFVNELTQRMPDAKLQAPQGGMFLWLQLPDIDTRVLAAYALDEQLAIVPECAFWPEEQAVRHGIRINTTHTPAHQITDGVNRLVSALARIQA